MKTLLPYIGTAIVAMLGTFILPKALRKKQSAEARSEEWKVWKDQIDTAATALRQANEANAAIMHKWQELSILHENAVKDSANKAIVIATQKVDITKITLDRDEHKIKAEKYKKENAELMKALEEVPRMREAMAEMADRIETLEAGLCSKNECKTRKK